MNEVRLQRRALPLMEGSGHRGQTDRVLRPAYADDYDDVSTIDDFRPYSSFLFFVTFLVDVGN